MSKPFDKGKPEITCTCRTRPRGTLCHPIQLAGDSMFYIFCFQMGSQFFPHLESPLFMVIYISIVRIEMPNKSNNILDVSQTDLQFACT